MIYEKQPIENAAVSVFEDNGFKMLVIEPYKGYKLRANGDDTYSTMRIMFSADFEDLLDNYHAVPIDEPDETIEEEDNAQSTDNEEISAEEALSIIIGGTDDDQS